MQDIKAITVKYLMRITAVIAVLILVTAMVLQIVSRHSQAIASSENVFRQVRQLLSENSSELESVKEDYSRMCLHSAEAIAYIIQNDPAVLNDIEELKKIAEFCDVDEIHLFNEEGVIYNGTHPQYYNMSVNDGEQIGFFAAMLEDKNAKLCQEVMPNTAENEMVQYSAVWSRNGKFFVQVGMKPERVMKATEKNELSYIFTLLRANSTVALYAADIDSGIIKGSTTKENIGRNLSDIGIPVEKIHEGTSTFYANVNGKSCYCVFTVFESEYMMLGRVITNASMYQNVVTATVILTLGIVLISFFLVKTVSVYLDKIIISGIKKLNGELKEIAEGNLDRTADVRSCLEFSELSDHINSMISTLFSSTDKISYILDKANMQIGVYEYNENMKTVRFTDKTSKILGIAKDEENALRSDYTSFRSYFKEHVKKTDIDGEEICRIEDGTDSGRYIKYEELSVKNGFLGIIIDVTEDVRARKQLENERDIDILTKLYNRRGFESRIREPLDKSRTEDIGEGALIMIDADGLKQINDRYGHKAGDMYLRGIADMIRDFGSCKKVSARLGGDEFVLFLYGYGSNESLFDDIDRLKETRKGTSVEVEKGVAVPVRFSFGVSVAEKGKNYSAMMKEADDKMYKSKRIRKKLEPNANPGSG